MLPYNSKASSFHFFLCSVLKGTVLLFCGGVFVIVVSMLETTSWFSVVHHKFLALWVWGRGVFFPCFFFQYSGSLGICLVYSWQIQWNASVKTSQLIFHLWMNRRYPVAKEGQASAPRGPAGCWECTIPQPTLASARNLLTFVLFHGRVIYHWHLLATSTGGHCSGARFKEVGRNWSRHFIS